jgi:enediyne biosynthesis protein E4
VVIRGDQRGSAVADFDGDARPDLAVAQNGGLTTLWRNVTGQRGVRVRVFGSARNPRGVGAVLRLEGEGWAGPARAVTAGTGQWSTDGATVVMSRPSQAKTLVVRWSDGTESRMGLPVGTDLVVRPPER